MKTIRLSNHEPDLEVEHGALPAQCWVFRPNAKTMRVTLWTSIPGQSRMFDIDEKYIKEVRD